MHDGEAKALNSIVSGDCATSVPEEWKFIACAASGDREGALRCLDELSQSWPEIYLVNRFVLDPSRESWVNLQRELQQPLLKAMAEVVAYSYGLSDTLPEMSAWDRELLGWGLAAHAAQQIANEDYVAARQTLAHAVEATRDVSPNLCAILLSQSAHIALACQVPSDLVQRELEQAIALASRGERPLLLGELYMQLGQLLQHQAAENRSTMLSSIRAYQTALQNGITVETTPVRFAELQNNLGLAYLSMPQSEASNQLRTGIAIQSFRHALTSIDRGTHEELWARIQMNLANALQYAPSSHPEENLVRAIEIYEEVLGVRTRARDPIAYALVILNQANALAHLGMFKPSLEKASEAYKLFQWYNHAEGAITARELVEKVNQQIERKQPSSVVSAVTVSEELQHGPV
jgi:tetratricopeptide (TPR) repeat protein